MGASLVVRTFPYNNGNLEKLRRLVRERISQDAYEDGHVYSGSWGSLHSELRFLDRTFESISAAQDWMAELEKDDLVAVKAKQIDSAILKSDAKLKALQEQARQLSDQLSREPSRLVAAARQSAEGFKTCKTCGSRIRLKFVRTTSCPLCGGNLLVTTKDQRIRTKLQTQQQKLNVKIQQRKEMLQKRSEKKAKTESLVWVVGAWCPS